MSPQKLTEPGETPQPACKGVRFRYRSRGFMSDRGEYIQQQVLRPLKRKSCPGCIQCISTLDTLRTRVAVGKLPLFGGVRDRDIVELDSINRTTEEVDDYDLIFVKANEQEK